MCNHTTSLLTSGLTRSNALECVMTSNQILTVYSLNDHEFVLCTGKLPLKYNQLQVDQASVIGILDTAVDEVTTKREICDYKIGDFVSFPY